MKHFYQGMTRTHLYGYFILLDFRLSPGCCVQFLCEQSRYTSCHDTAINSAKHVQKPTHFYD